MKTSQSIVNISAALLQAQRTFEVVKKNSKNPFFKSKYADISGILAEVKPKLNAVGITLLQPTVEGGVETVLLHESGEFISGFTQTRMTTKPVLDEKKNVVYDQGRTIYTVEDNPQTHGGAITYARRYGLLAILGLETEDDDAEAAMGRNNTRRAKSNSDDF